MRKCNVAVGIIVNVPGEVSDKESTDIIASLEGIDKTSGVVVGNRFSEPPHMQFTVFPATGEDPESVANNVRKTIGSLEC